MNGGRRGGGKRPKAADQECHDFEPVHSRQRRHDKVLRPRDCRPAAGTAAGATGTAMTWSSWRRPAAGGVAAKERQRASEESESDAMTTRELEPREWAE